ncbi:MAG: TIM barrel protein [Pseudomonadota bacterium]
MTTFSANLGFLFSDRPLPEAIIAAKAAGFDAVECHWPYDVPTADMNAALSETGLKMLGLNTRRGNVDQGENGLAALPGRESEARDAIDEAIGYAADVGAANVHVMAGFDQSTAGHETFLKNVTYACKRAAERKLTILIEPLNPHDAPGYFLRTTGHAADVIEAIGTSNLKLMFDCYHVARTEGNVITRLQSLMPMIGHIQFASVPDRGPPERGDVDYAEVFAEIKALGWNAPLGAEYKPNGPTELTLGWLQRFGR